MKKLLFICNNLQYSDGVSISLRNLVNAVADRYEIHILNLYKYDKHFADGLNQKIQVHNVFKHYFKGLRLITNSFLLPIIRKYTIFRENKYDIIISFQYGTPTVLCSYLKNDCGFDSRFIGFIHGFAEDQLSYYKNFNAIISISEYGATKTNQLLPGYNGIIKHISNIYDEKEIIRKSKFCNGMASKIKNSNKKIFCVVGRIDFNKGIDRFVKAIYIAHKSDESIVGIIVGDGTYADIIRSMIESYKAGSYIIMVGETDNPYPIMKQCDYVCCPSRSEGLSTVCVEAAILQKPILSTRVSGAEEIILNPTIGCIVNNDDESLVEGISSIIKMEISEEAFACSAAKWSSKRIIEEYNTLFETL